MAREGTYMWSEHNHLSYYDFSGAWKLVTTFRIYLPLLLFFLFSSERFHHFLIIGKPMEGYLGLIGISLPNPTPVLTLAVGGFLPPHWKIVLSKKDEL